MSHLRIGLACLLILSPLTLGVAADEKAEDIEGGRRQRLEFMRSKLAEFDLQTESDPQASLKLAAEPALRWSNPVRGIQVDGATFFWLQGARPVATATISIRKEGRIFREFTMLAEEPLTATRRGRIVWSPRKGGQRFDPFDDAPTPARSPAIRLTEMRSLARRFHADLSKGKRIDARLLTQPLIRYADADAGVIDGAVFAFAEATDPEVFLVLEARKDDTHAGGRWLYSVARSTSVPVEVRLGSDRIWTVTNYYNNPRSPSDPYVEAFEGTYSPEEPK